jgi:hypothetical protein
LSTGSDGHQIVRDQRFAVATFLEGRLNDEPPFDVCNESPLIAERAQRSNAARTVDP